MFYNILYLALASSMMSQKEFSIFGHGGSNVIFVDLENNKKF